MSPLNTPGRICHIIDRFHPVVGGTENQCLQLAKELSRHGVTSIVLTKRFLGTSKEQSVDGIDVKRLSYFSLTTRGKLYYIITLLFFIIPAIVFVFHNRRSIRILHFHGALDLYGLIAFVGSMCGIASVAKVASVRQREAGYIRGAIAQSARISLVKNFDRLIAISTEVQAALLAEGYSADRIATIQNGVDVEAFSPPKNKGEEKKRLSLDERCKYITFVGRLVAVKNIAVLYHAFAELSQKGQFDDFRVMVIGSGQGQVESTEEQLATLAANLNIEGRILRIFASLKVNEYLRASDIFVLPSLSEGLPNSLLEAMATGLPCLGSRVVGISHLIEDGRTGLLFDPKDPHALVSCLSRVCLDNDFRTQLGGAARDHVVRFYSLESTAGKYVKLYSELASQ